ncbi:hypothetical protein [Nocardia pseudobrasiliensis]|uniref:hypothetical protein n=1 Tax=Nocardia pseudobrasiliensis TaxID=45979 RepID=UPI0035A245DC
MTLHYLEDWHSPLTAIRRVLKPGGRLILSVEHPLVMWFTALQAGNTTNYFATRPRHVEDMAGQAAGLTFWDRSLSTMFKTFFDTGFRVTHLDEPGPAPAALEQFPKFFEDKDDPAFWFSCSWSSSRKVDVRTEPIRGLPAKCETARHDSGVVCIVARSSPLPSSPSISLTALPDSGENSARYRTVRGSNDFSRRRGHHDRRRHQPHRPERSCGDGGQRDTEHHRPRLYGAQPSRW